MSLLVYYQKPAPLRSTALGLFYYTMAKDTFYFSHDYNTRNDEKIKFLTRKYGMAGYGIFWAIIEDLYNNANALRTDYDGIAYDLRVDSDTVKSIINDFDLFVFDGEHFGSLSVQNRIDERDSKSVKARESAHKRWTNANAMPTQCDSNAIKERKGKEIKEKKESKVKERKAPHLFEESFLNDILTFKNSFVGTPYESANFEYYQEIIGSWAKSKAEKKADWVAAARNWMARDLRDGKFIDNKYKPNGNSKTQQTRVSHITDQQLHEAFAKRFGSGQ